MVNTLKNPKRELRKYCFLCHRYKDRNNKYIINVSGAITLRRTQYRGGKIVNTRVRNNGYFVYCFAIEKKSRFNNNPKKIVTKTPAYKLFITIETRLIKKGKSGK
ncbi:hypothetical protein HY041_02290 [Candidatus Roizmanbacteria bacterium]|nr:hypothetical protein [Candidatus Roizmanbacteria bacterium]